MAASLVQNAGLAALLSPKSTAGVAKTACFVVGCAYPVYRTFKALERRRFLFDNSREGALTYWSVFGCLNMAEAASEPFFQWFPWYFHCKLGLLIWLQSRNGAEKMYREFLRPLLRKHEESVDEALGYLDREVGGSVSEAETEVGKLVAFAGAASRAVKDAITHFLSNAS
uniref:HVA22-like protein n=1 Tax=Chloropicon laureae TaxID=464258 RepID=A0A7S2YWL1_9CHLO